MKHSFPVLRGRGTDEDPANRFERLHIEPLPKDDEDPAARSTQYFRDASRSVLTRNLSPDVGFDWSLNPYRGCEHGCSYCYARPTHEYLGLSAGLDFESKIFVKPDAPELLEWELASPRWKPEHIAMSGVTDPYQPVERRLGITRGCMEVLVRARHPVAVVTKSRLVERDADLLGELARYDAAHVAISITTLDRSLQRAMEPRASPPEHRLEAVRALVAAGVPVTVFVAPVIPGLTDHEVAAIIEAAAEAGATEVGYMILRLPGAVRQIFLSWMDDHCPDRAEKVKSRLRNLRGGKLNESAFGKRMRGEGPFADQIRSLFHVSREKAGFPRRVPALSTEHFRRPGRPPRAAAPAKPQLDLF